PIFNPATLGRLVSTSGTRADHTASTNLAPGIQNAYVRQAAAYIEREVAANFGIRGGFVWNGTRQNYATINTNQPFSAFNVPVTVTSAGPDNITGTSDDVTLTA